MESEGQTEVKRLIEPVIDEGEELESSSHHQLMQRSLPPPYCEDDEAVSSTAAAVRSGWRHSWILATIVLCLYGFFKEFKPSEPFLTPYLTSDFKNFTKNEVLHICGMEVNDRYPLATLSKGTINFIIAGGDK